MPLFVPVVASVGVSGGNTSGNTGLDQGKIAFAGGTNITLSQATDSIGASITINGLAPGVTRYANVDWGGSANPFASLGTVNGSMQLFPMQGGDNLFPGNMSAKTLFFDMTVNHTNTSATTQAQTLRYSVGIYTLAGASSLSLLNSASGSITAPGTSNQSTQWHGARYLTVNSSQFSASLTFSQTSYWMGIIFSSSGTSNSNFSYIGGYRAATANVRSGLIGAQSSSGASVGWEPWAGVVGTAALPASIHISGVTKTGVSGGFIPHFVLEALHSTW